MTIQSSTTLKSYFETGDKPTQAQYGDLIDSTINQQVYNIQTLGASVTNTASANQPIFEAAVSASNISGFPVYVPAVASGSYYSLRNTLNLRNYGSIRGDGELSRLRWMMNAESSAYSCINTDCIKNFGNVNRLMLETDSSATSVNSNSVAIQIGAGKGTAASINTNMCVDIGHNKFGIGFYDQIYGNQEMDNTHIHHNLSFATVGRSRLYYLINATNREAPAAGVRISQNHFSDTAGGQGTNLYGLYIQGTDGLVIDGNIINNHNVNYYLDSPSDASMHENMAPVMLGNYAEENRPWVSAASRWTALTALTSGTVIRPTKANANGLIAVVSGNGTTGAYEPVWASAGCDNFGPSQSVSKITDGTVTFAMRYASIGTIVAGQKRKASIIGMITKSLIAAFVGRTASKFTIEGCDTGIVAVEPDVFFCPSGNQPDNGYCEIRNTTVRGNLKPWRSTANDQNIYDITLDHSSIVSGTDSTGFFPINGTGTYSSYPTFVAVSAGGTFTQTNNASASDITGMALRVKASTTYCFESVLYTTSPVSGGVRAAIAGRTTSPATVLNVTYNGFANQNGSALASLGSRATALNTAVCVVTAALSANLYLTGTFTTVSAGFITPRFAQAAIDAASSTVQPNSTFKIWEIQ